MKKVGVVFSGFGSQFVGMAKGVYDDSRQVQEYFEEAHNCLGVNFVKLCFASSDQELSKIYNAYLSIFLVNISLYTLLNDLGIEPDVVAGHGVGRYAAIFVGGGITLPDALYLLNKYSNFYQEFLDHNKIKVLEVDGLSLRKAKALCKEIGEDVFVTASNSETNQFISGHIKHMEKLEKKLSEMMVEDKKLNFKERLPGLGINSQLTQEVIDAFKIYLEKVDFKDLKMPFISSVNGKEIQTAAQIKQEVVDQVTNPIMWQKVVQKLGDYDTIIEVGPGDDLALKIRESYPEKLVLTLNCQADVSKIKEAFGCAKQAGEDCEEKSE